MRLTKKQVEQKSWLLKNDYTVLRASVYYDDNGRFGAYVADITHMLNLSAPNGYAWKVYDTVSVIKALESMQRVVLNGIVVFVEGLVTQDQARVIAAYHLSQREKTVVCPND